MSEQDTQLPCELPCPKCGASDVRRRWYDKGHPVPEEDYGKCRNRYAAGLCRSYEANREHLDHHCRCCAYRWQTPVLPKKRKAKSAAPAAQPDKETRT